MKFSVLHFCAQKNNVDACRILLDLGCDPNAMTYKVSRPTRVMRTQRWRQVVS